MFILLSVAVFFGTVNKFYTKVYLKDVDSFSMLFITNSILSFILLPVVLYNFGSLKSIPVGGWLFILFACSAWSVAGYLLEVEPQEGVAVAEAVVEEWFT
jgi:drug/metabolite transporter (DMT)-like permease